MSTGLPEHAPRLVGDIGGTNARFAIIATPDGRPSRIRTLPCADFAGPEQAIRTYLELEQMGAPPVAALGIANPVTGDHVAMTNHHWRFSVEELRARLGLERLVLVNDFTALALSLPHLRASECRQVGRGEAEPGHPIGLLGPGTGLGVSGLIPCAGTHTPLEGEGGHITLPARSTRELAIIAALGERYGHVSAERVLSGPGLIALHDAIRQVNGLAPLALGSAEISERALADKCRHCVEALQTFCAMLGTVAADLALTLGARGGIYIGGGIVPRLGDFFARSAFRRRFEDKGRFSAYLARIPTIVIHAPYSALVGAARALEVPLSGACDARAAAARSDGRSDPSIPTTLMNR